MKGYGRLLLMIVAGLSGIGCTPVQDPWVSGDQYAQERQRGAAQAAALQERLTRVQTDR